MTKEEKKINDFRNSCDGFEVEIDRFLDELSTRDFSERSNFMSDAQAFRDERRELYENLPKDLRERSFRLADRAKYVLALSGTVERFAKLQDVFCGLL